jgi:hypothetical protein
MVPARAVVAVRMMVRMAVVFILVVVWVDLELRHVCE